MGTETHPPVAAKAGPERLGVVLVEPIQLVRAGLTLLIEGQPDMEVLIQASSAEECLDAIKAMRRRSGTVVLVGLNLPGKQDGFWLIRAIRDIFPTLPILATTFNAEEQVISRALFVGADSVVDKNVAPAEFADAIRRTSRGELVLLGVPAERLGAVADGLDMHRDADDILTEREREVLSVAAEGLTARQIGHRLGLRERTVTTHLARIYRKLGAPGRVAAINFAARSGWVTVVNQE